MGELVDHLMTMGKIESGQRQKILASVWRRESLFTTGVGFAIAIAHAEIDSVSEVVAAVGRSRDGIEFEAADGKPVHLVLLLLVPEGQFKKLVAALANFAKLIHRKGFREWLWDETG